VNQKRKSPNVEGRKKVRMVLVPVAVGDTNDDHGSTDIVDTYREKAQKDRRQTTNK
jgi:hypothetical protein